jgi:hypothetical protein
MPKPMNRAQRLLVTVPRFEVYPRPVGNFAFSSFGASPSAAVFVLRCARRSYRIGGRLLLSLSLPCVSLDYPATRLSLVAYQYTIHHQSIALDRILADVNRKLLSVRVRRFVEELTRLAIASFVVWRDCRWSASGS